MKYLESIELVTKKTPERTAIETSDGLQWTYGELWRASDALAAFIAERVSLSTPVMVYGHKNPLMVACFLACLKSGHPYVPVDCHSVPPQRVASIVGQLADDMERREEQGLPLVLAVEALPVVEGAPQFNVVNREELDDAVQRGGSCSRSHWVMGEDLAYILFTSGSTGAPKGVQVTAACFDNFCAWDLQLAQREGMVWLDQAPFSFDLSVFELAGALASGGTLFCLTHDAQQSMAAQMAALGSSQVGAWVSTPSFAAMCLASKEFSAALLPDLELFLFCGETLPNATAAQLLERFPGARVLNTYGPTESTVAVTSVEITPELAAAAEPLPVGRARSGTRLRIVDAEGTACEPGVFGEVVIEGDTVARGYFGRPDLTERAFGEAELGGVSVRTYRTGDEGCLDNLGMLRYRGRLDLQVKLNGYRIELGDIEEHIRRLPEVTATAVVPAYRDGRIAHLVAHVVRDTPLDESAFRAGLALKEELKGSLPHYMIPKKVVFCDALPMTGNGKIDRKALAASV